MIHEPELLRAVAALDDRLTVAVRLREIEQALKFDDDPERRRRLKSDFLDLTDRKAAA